MSRIVFNPANHTLLGIDNFTRNPHVEWWDANAWTEPEPDASVQVSFQFGHTGPGASLVLNINKALLDRLHEPDIIDAIIGALNPHRIDAFYVNDPVRHTIYGTAPTVS